MEDDRRKRDQAAYQADAERRARETLASRQRVAPAPSLGSIQVPHVQQPSYVPGQYAQQPRPVPGQYAQQVPPVLGQYVQQPLPVPGQHVQRPHLLPEQYVQQLPPLSGQYAQQDQLPHPSSQLLRESFRLLEGAGIAPVKGNFRTGNPDRSQSISPSIASVAQLQNRHWHIADDMESLETEWERLNIPLETLPVEVIAAPKDLTKTPPKSISSALNPAHLKSSVTSLKSMLELCEKEGLLKLLGLKDYISYLRGDLSPYKLRPDADSAPNLSGIDEEDIHKDNLQVEEVWRNVFRRDGLYTALETLGKYETLEPPVNEMSVEHSIGRSFYYFHMARDWVAPVGVSMTYPPYLTAFGSNGSPDFRSWAELRKPARRSQGRLSDDYNDNRLKYFKVTMAVSDAKTSQTGHTVLTQLATYLHAPLNMLIMAICQQKSNSISLHVEEPGVLDRAAIIYGCSYNESRLEIYAFFPSYRPRRRIDNVQAHLHWEYNAVGPIIRLPIGANLKQNFNALAALRRMHRHNHRCWRFIAENLEIPRELLNAAPVPVQSYPERITHLRAGGQEGTG